MILSRIDLDFKAILTKNAIWHELRGDLDMRKVKSYDSFASWLKDQSVGQKRIISKLRKLVSRTSPKLIESSKWTNGVWLKGDLPLIFIHTEPDHVQFGFFAGAMLSDPKTLLQGKGKYVRHIRLEKLSDINETAFATMIRRAVKAPTYK